MTAMSEPRTTADLPEGSYWVETLVFPKATSTSTVKAVDGMLRWPGGGGYSGKLAANRRPATPDEIAAYEALDADRRRQAAEHEAKENALLAAYGLSRSDFCRFRSVSEKDGALVVETRENGIGGRSIDAIRKGNLLDTGTDDGDSTYQWYRFAPLAAASPQQGADQ
jgi:hypothetical protein